MRQIKTKINTRDFEVSRFVRSGGNDLYRLLLKRNYKIPKNYTNWQALAALIAFVAPQFGNSIFDLATQFTSHRAALWVVQDAPIYCLDKSLFELFIQTDVGDENLIFSDLIQHLPIHSLLLLLPENVVRSPDGGYVDYLNIHCSSIDHPEWSEGEKYGLKVPYLKHEHDVNIHYGTIDRRQTVWFSGWGINRSDGKIYQTDVDLGRDRSDEQDKLFLAGLRNIVMQSLMFLSFEQTKIDSVIYQETISTQGFGRAIDHKEKYLYPRWLRLQQKIPATKITCNSKSSHASPSPHWRRGHWRRSAVGEGRIDRKWNWIQPVLVKS